MEKGTCRLCLMENVDLCKSHIIPKFFRTRSKREHSKKTERFWGSQNIGQWQNDLLKPYFLCRDCEDTFNRNERYFANHYNKSIYSKPSKYKEGELRYFILSMAWRCLQEELEQPRQLCDIRRW